MPSKPILVTGATGYVGGRLVLALLEAGYRVRAMGRLLDKLGCRPVIDTGMGPLRGCRVGRRYHHELRLSRPHKGIG